MPLAPAGGALMCSKHRQSKDVAALDLQVFFFFFFMISCDSCSADAFRRNCLDGFHNDHTRDII